MSEMKAFVAIFGAFLACIYLVGAAEAAALETGGAMQSFPGRRILVKLIQYDELGDEITKHYKRPGHPNDGNEGNEGNEGKDEPAPTPPAAGGDGKKYDVLGDEITKHYKRPGHPNDGNEGNEGNEGADEKKPSPPASPTGDGIKYDECGDVITKHYRRPGHPNDGNEGNEGNEGADEVPSKGCSAKTPSPPTPSPAVEKKYDIFGDEITPNYIEPGHPNDGNEGNEGNEGEDEKNAQGAPVPNSKKVEVCVHGSEEHFGNTPKTDPDYKRPNGIIVHADGRCEVMEYAGGFDGYFSIDAGDGHEDGFARAVKYMLGDRKAKVGAKYGRNHPDNLQVNAFLRKIRRRADPVNLDYPKDKDYADNGGRMKNIDKVSKACTEMIKVRTNC